MIAAAGGAISGPRGANYLVARGAGEYRGSAATLGRRLIKGKWPRHRPAWPSSQAALGVGQPSVLPSLRRCARLALAACRSLSRIIMGELWLVLPKQAHVRCFATGMADRLIELACIGLVHQARGAGEIPVDKRTQQRHSQSGQVDQWRARGRRVLNAAVKTFLTLTGQGCACPVRGVCVWRRTSCSTWRH
jgi:hypothetical protein